VGQGAVARPAVELALNLNARGSQCGATGIEHFPIEIKLRVCDAHGQRIASIVERRDGFDLYSSSLNIIIVTVAVVVEEDLNDGESELAVSYLLPRDNSVRVAGFFR